MSLALAKRARWRAGCGTFGTCRYLIGLLLAVLGMGAAEPITLDIPVFAGGYGTAFYEETARLFEAERPDVRIKLYGDPRISDKIRIRVIEGNLPDAMLPFNVLIPALARAGKLLDLAPYLDGPNWEGDRRWRDTFHPGALGAWNVAGGEYGLPFAYACWSLFYNRRLFREYGWSEPRTWEEFFALLHAIKTSDAGVAPIALTGIYGNYPDAFVRAAFYNLAGAAGWSALNELRPGAYADADYIRAAGILQRLTRDYALPGWEGMTHTGAQLALVDGRAAMTVSGSWMINEMAGKLPPDFELGVLNFPVFADGRADPTTIQTGADNFFAFATGRPEHERTTIDFLRFLTSRARAEAFVRRMDAPVAVRGIPVSSFSPAMQETARLIEQAREAFNMPQMMLQAPAVRQALIDERLRLMRGEISPTEFAARVEAAAAQERARAAQPERVEYRHPLAGGALLLGLGSVSAFLLWTGWRRRREARAGTTDAFFGRLRFRMALLFVGPALLLYGGLVLVPGATALGWSLTRWDGMTERHWAGWRQFERLLFESDAFWPALSNNVFIMVVPALVIVPVALTFAALFHRGVWGAGAFRVIFLFPNLLGGIAAALLWLNAYEPHGGLINASLVGLGEWTGSDWLQSFRGYPWLAPSNLYRSLVPVYLWMACGFNLILYLAAMEGIDPQLYEAAEIEGAPRWRQFFGITLPLIWDVILVSGVFLIIGGLNAFELVWLLTAQDPGTATHTLGTLMVSSMFKEFDVGRATAIAVVLFVLVITASALFWRGLRREAVE